MIQLIIGNKGSGKTKKLIESATAAAAVTKGYVVCVEQGDSLAFNLNTSIRLVDTSDYAIAGYDTLYGLLAGICAGNYDVTDIFVDATLRIGGRDFTAVAGFLKRVAKLSDAADTKFVFTISCDKDELPSEVFDIAEAI